MRRPALRVRPSKKRPQVGLFDDAPRELFCDREWHLFMHGGLVCACPQRRLFVLDAWALSHQELA
jgi:hypothetical protein